VGCVGWRRRALERYPLITRVRYRANNSSSPSVDERNRVVDAAYFKIVRTDPDKPDCPSLTNCRSRVRCLATRGLALDCGRRGSRHLRWRLERLGFGSLSQWVLAIFHLSGLRGGLNGSTQHQFEAPARGFQGSFASADSNGTPPSAAGRLGSLGKVLSGQRIRWCCIDRLSWQRLSGKWICAVVSSDAHAKRN